MAVNIYDFIFLVAFFLFSGIFLYRNRNKLGKEGIMYLYRTKFGIKVIDWFGKKHSRWLKALEWPLYIICYGLMIFSVFYFTYIFIQYLINSQVRDALVAPVVMPVIPYFTEFFGLKSILPTFYFVDFIVAISLTMIVHEFSHGIYARMYNVRIKSTGFAFIGPILANFIIAIKTKKKSSIINTGIFIGVLLLLALFTKQWLFLLFVITPFFGAFVEQDDKQMVKAPKRGQLSILGAGVFSNVLLMFLFIGLLWVFFLAAYQPTGVIFNDYAKKAVNTTDVLYADGYTLERINMSSYDYSNQSQYIQIIAKDNNTYYTSPAALNASINGNYGFVVVFDSPAFNSRLRGVITEIDGKKITSMDELTSNIRSYRPGETVNVRTRYEGEEMNFNVTLGEKDGYAYMGIVSYSLGNEGSIKKLFVYLSMITPKRENFITKVVYESKIGDELGGFIFNLLWWTMLLNFAVAVANMLPAGIFDGGRYFMITVWGLTKSKKAGETAFKISTWYIIGLLLLFTTLQLLNMI